MTFTSRTNEAFYERAETAFRNLFNAARAKHELHFAMALMPEMRGMQGAGWNTAVETHHAFDEYLEFLEGQEDGRMKCRVAISFYCHIAEASGFYEVPKNLLRIAGGQSHVLWPFNDLVAHRQTGDRIAPNANKILKDLAGHSKDLGFDELADVFREAFDPDVRNGYAHADYIVWSDGLRLPKRNGGQPRRISWEEFDAIFKRGINFFHILRRVVAECVHSYDPPKAIRAQLQNEPERDWTIYYEPKSNAFGIASGKYPNQT
jgi:hypothetical protein